MVVPVNIGLLIIRGNTDNVKRKLQRLLELAASKVAQKLYVHLEESESFEELLPAIYLSAACIKSEVDFRVLMDRKTVQVDRVFYDKVWNFFNFKGIFWMGGGIRGEFSILIYRYNSVVDLSSSFCHWSFASRFLNYNFCLLLFKFYFGIPLVY
ncbi:unnamed protein product [Meloidogyne enterolobii]|uniref:Uncharacterized protein n=1 Tax=Meloidogyne enterolobii TaxID=390850 RepID=A0ACB0ZDR9_MELEN